MQSQNKDCYNRAVKILVRREYSVVELTQKLKDKGFFEDDISTAMFELQQQNYQSDARFAEMIITARVNQGKGFLLISKELQKHQITDFDTSEIDFFELCTQVKIKKFGEEQAKDQKEKAKQIRFLQSRGFRFDEIMNCFHDL